MEVHATHVSEGIWIDPLKFRNQKSVAKKRDTHSVSWQPFSLKWHCTVKCKKIVRVDSEVLGHIKLGPERVIYLE